MAPSTAQAIQPQLLKEATSQSQSHAPGNPFASCQTRLNGFLTLPTEPLEPEEARKNRSSRRQAAVSSALEIQALSSHYLELHFGRPSLFSWGRGQDRLTGRLHTCKHRSEAASRVAWQEASATDSHGDASVLPYAIAAVQPRLLLEVRAQLLKAQRPSSQ